MLSHPVRFSIVVLANDHNPTILNPDFLKAQNIVPGDWELAGPPITTPPFATVEYNSGVSISVDSNKLQVTDNKTQIPNDSKVKNIVHQYVETLSYVRYLSLGINFRYITEMDNADVFLKDHFLKEGPWSQNSNDLKAIGFKFVYPLEGGRLVLSLDSASMKTSLNDQGEENSVIIANANFHRNLDLKKPLAEEISSILGKISEDWDRFNEIQSCMLKKNDN